jgi:hypothetical protein
MSETSENKMNEKPVKRGPGCPKKGTPPVVKPKPKIGCPKKYEEGYNDHKFPRMLIDRKEYKRLLEIEQ